jgi:hypothetical protein
MLHKTEGPYRYAAWDQWNEETEPILFVGLRPTPQPDVDPTIQAACTLARSWGLGGARIGNLYASRYTPWDEGFVPLDDPFGPKNDEWLKRMARGARMVICCWGRSVSVHTPSGGAGRYLKALLPNIDLMCLGITPEGFPVALKGQGESDPIPWEGQ